MNKVIVTALMLFAPATAFAYFDAGTGALIMQGLVGALTFLVVFWGRVKVYIQSLLSPAKEPPQGDDVEILMENEQTGDVVDSDANADANVDGEQRL
jgi:hypothetical protein